VPVTNHYVVDREKPAPPFQPPDFVYSKTLLGPRTRSSVVAALLILSACKDGTGVLSDITPSMAIADVTVAEGTVGTVLAVFNVTLSAATARTVTVQYATADGSASAPDDFASVSGTLTFGPGQTTQPITVPVVSDIVGEPSTEIFTVVLTSATNATISDGSATGTITDDDDCAPQGTLSAGDHVSGTLAATDCTWTVATDYFDMWLWTAADTATFAVDLTSNAGDFDPFLGLFELDGANSLQMDGGAYGVNARQIVTVPPGTYVIYAAASTSAGETGDYDLTVTEVPDATEFYASGGSVASSLYLLDVDTGAADSVGAIGFDRVSAMDFHPTTRVLYAEGERTLDAVRVLISIDRMTGIGTEVGPTGLTKEIAGMSFRSDGTLFLYTTGHILYTADLTTGAATAVGATGNPMRGGNGIAFDGADVLYHSNQDESHTLDQTTGTASFLADMNFPVPCQDADPLATDGRFSGVDLAPGYGDFYGIVKCAPGSSDPSAYLGRVEFDTGYVVIIGQSADRLDGFAILN
jgi:hypothetical protein